MSSDARAAQINDESFPPNPLNDNPDLLTPDNVDERTWLADQFRTMNRAFMRVIPRADVWHNLDLTMPQMKLLMELVQRGHLRMGAIADALGMPISTATGIVDRLVERKLVQRVEAPDDRRVVVVGVTEAGTTLITDLLQARQSNMERMINRLSNDELRIIAKSMAILYRVAIEDHASGTNRD